MHHVPNENGSCASSVSVCFSSAGRGGKLPLSPVSAVRPYCRELDLVRLLPLWPRQVRDESAAGTQLIVALLEKALRGERCRGKAGHWTYSLSRHKALKEALEAERKKLGKARLLEAFEQRRAQKLGKGTACEEGGGNGLNQSKDKDKRK